MQASFENLQKLDSRRLSYVLILPDGSTAGRFEAAEAFADLYAQLVAKHPDSDFHLMPFSYRQTSDPGVVALDAIMAIQK